jgi:hypothetical protein
MPGIARVKKTLLKSSGKRGPLSREKSDRWKTEKETLNGNVDLFGNLS